MLRIKRWWGNVGRRPDLAHRREFWGAWITFLFEEYSFQRCGAMQSGRSPLTFRRDVLPLSKSKSSTVLRNVGGLLPDCTVLHPGRYLVTLKVWPCRLSEPGFVFGSCHVGMSAGALDSLTEMSRCSPQSLETNIRTVSSSCIGTAAYFPVLFTSHCIIIFLSH
jgi:hypothetical protein